MTASLLRMVPLVGAIWLSAASPGRSVETPRTVCSLDRPVIGRHQAAGITAYSVGPAAGRHYRWHAAAGSFTMPSDPASVTWSPGGAAPGTYRLSVSVSGGAGACAVDVLVTEAARAAPAAPGNLGSEAERDLLVRGSQEHDGYGLYSYILLASRPDDGNRDRYRAVVESYLRLEDVNLPMYFPTAELNVTYVPVEAAPVRPPDADWVLDHYDYARARFLLSRLGIRDGDGPFIVSALHPLGAPMARGRRSGRICPPCRSAWCRPG